MRIGECIRKDRTALLILSILPLIVPLILCYVYGGIYIERIPFGIANLDDSSLSRSIVSGFENHPGLDVIYYASSGAELEDAIKSKKISGGLLIPDNLSRDLNRKNSPEILILIDGTNLLIGNNALGYSSAILNTFNAQIQLSLLEGKGLLPSAAEPKMVSFTFVDRVLYDPQLSYMCYVVYIAVVYMIQMFYLNFYLLPILIEEKKALLERKESLSEILRRSSLLKRLAIMFATICVCSWIGLCLAGEVFGLPVRGSVLAFFTLLAAFLLALTAAGLVLSFFLNKRTLVYFIEAYMTVSLLFIFTSGAVWPEYMMPQGLPEFVKATWPYIHAALIFKYLNLKGIGWDLLLPYIGRLLCYTVCWSGIGIALYVFKMRRQGGFTAENGTDPQRYVVRREKRAGGLD